MPEWRYQLTEKAADDNVLWLPVSTTNGRVMDSRDRRLRVALQFALEHSLDGRAMGAVFGALASLVETDEDAQALQLAQKGMLTLVGRFPLPPPGVGAPCCRSCGAELPSGAVDCTPAPGRAAPACPGCGALWPAWLCNGGGRSCNVLALEGYAVARCPHCDQLEDEAERRGWGLAQLHSMPGFPSWREGRILVNDAEPTPAL